MDWRRFEYRSERVFDCDRAATSELDPRPEIHIWGRCRVRRDGKLVHVDRAGHPSVSSFFNTDDTKEEYNASEPVNDRKRWLDQFVHLMGHTGNYTLEEAIAAIESTLPDVLSLDPSKPAKYPNGRVFTDDVINYRIAFSTKNQCPPTGLKPHTDILKEFPYMGTPHSKSSRAKTDFGADHAENQKMGFSTPFSRPPLRLARRLCRYPLGFYDVALVLSTKLTTASRSSPARPK
jgi:hypothetical protein